MRMQLQILERRASRAINRSRLGLNVINPYSGCPFACAYCYARLYTRENLPWGTYVIVRTNIPRLLVKEARSVRSVWLSSMSDPYNPVEEVYGITRRILHVLRRAGVHVDILTKSPLVLRDLDLLKGMDAEVGFTITTLAPTAWEARALPPKERIRALRVLHEEGVRTYVFIGPVLPQTDVRAIVRATKDYADYFYVDRLRHTSELGLPPFYPDRESIRSVLEEEGVSYKLLF